MILLSKNFNLNHIEIELFHCLTPSSFILKCKYVDFNNQPRLILLDDMYVDKIGLGGYIC